VAEIAYLFHKDYLTDESGQKYYASPYLARVQDTDVQSRIDALASGWVTNVTALENVPGQLSDLAALIATANVAYTTKAVMDADDTQDDGTVALVFNDSTASNNGLYLFTVGSPGSWSATTLQLASASDLAAKADATRAISAAGLATGGGDLSADRTITVAEASASEAAAGTSGTTVLTPRRGVTTAEAAMASAGLAKNDVEDVWQVLTDDLYRLAGLDPNGNGWWLDLIYSVGERAYGFLSADGALLFEVNEDLGSQRGALDAQRFAHGLTHLPVIAGEGAIDSVTVSAEFCQFRRDGLAMVSHFTGDAYAPILLDGPAFELFETDGRSWMVRDSNYASECDVLDDTGRTRFAVERLGRALTTTQRAIASNATVTDQPYRKRSYSDDESIEDFYRQDWSAEWTLGGIIAALVDLRRAEFNLARPQLIHASCGQGGQTPDKFLPEGSSYTAGETTVNAALVDGNTHYLWAANVKLRSEIQSILADTYRRDPQTYTHLVTAFSPDSTVALEEAFLAEYRTQQDALGLGTRNIFWIPNVEQVDSPQLTAGAQGLVNFCDTNTSGADWLAAAGHPYPLDDRTHRTSWSNVALAEVVALAVTYVERFGDWAPPQLDPTSVSIDGADLSIAVTSPRQTTGTLQTESERMPARADLGFNLLEGSTELVSSVSVSGNVVTITATEALAGKNLELNYAALPAPGFDYENAPDGTVNTPQYSSCYGKLYFDGVDAPVVLNEPTVKHFVPATIFDISA
jgi:hypothetical protein